MDESISSRLNVLDFLITVLRQHEQGLDNGMAKLDAFLSRLENWFSELNLEETPSNGRAHLPLEDPSRVGNRFDLEPITTKKTAEYLLKQIELLILNLSIQGKAVEEIAFRLDMTPNKVKTVIQGLVRKGYLRPRKNVS